MIMIELTEIRNAMVAEFAGEAPATAKVLLDLSLIASVTETNVDVPDAKTGCRIELRASGTEPRRTIVIKEAYSTVRSLLAKHATIVTIQNG